MEKDEAPKVLKETIFFLSYIAVMLLVILIMTNWIYVSWWDTLVSTLPGLIIFAIIGLTTIIILSMALVIQFAGEKNLKLEKEIKEIRKKYPTYDIQKYWIAERKADYKWKEAIKRIEEMKQ